MNMQSNSKDIKTKHNTGLVLVLLFNLIHLSCGASELPKDKYCGQELTNQELNELSKQSNKTYHYSEKDLDLLADLTTDVHALFNDSLKVEVFFFLHDKNQIGLIINGLDNQSVVEKISCLILSNKYDQALPKARYIFFYCNEHGNLVAGIRNKK